MLGDDHRDAFLCYLLGLEKALAKWVDHYNHERYHESLGYITPADVYEDRRNDILDQQTVMKSRTISWRKVHNLRSAG